MPLDSKEFLSSENFFSAGFSIVISNFSSKHAYNKTEFNQHSMCFYFKGPLLIFFSIAVNLFPFAFYFYFSLKNCNFSPVTFLSPLASKLLFISDNFIWVFIFYWCIIFLLVFPAVIETLFDGILSKLNFILYYESRGSDGLSDKSIVWIKLLSGYVHYVEFGITP